MFKSVFVCILFCMGMFNEGFSQSSPQSANSNYSYHPPSQDKPSWQWLSLWLSSNFYRGMKLSTIDQDSSMLVTSHSIGISRLAYAADGIDNPELLAQSQWFDQRSPGTGIRLLSAAKGKKHLELMILIGSYYTFQPANYKLYRDSVEYFLNKAIAESKAINEKRLGRVALCLLGKMYAQGADTANANAVFNRLIKECQAAGDKRTELRALIYRALYTTRSPTSIQDKLGYYQKAIVICHDLKDIESEIVVRSNLGFIYLALNRMDDSFNSFVTAFQLQNSIGYPYTQYTADHISMVKLLMGEFGEPLKYSLESIKVSEAVRDSIGWPHFYLRLGQIYYMEGGREEETVKWMLKSFDRFVMAGDEGLSVTLFNIVTLMNGKPGREQEALNLVLDIAKKIPPRSAKDQMGYNMSLATCYTSLKQYGLAEQHAVAADSILNLSHDATIADPHYKKAIKVLFIALNMAKGQYGLAKKALEENFADSVHLSTLSDDIQAYQRLIFIDSVLHDPVSAVSHYKQYMQLVDSNYRVSRIRQGEELNVIYETQEKQNQITLLNQQAQLKEANLKQATLVKNLTVAGIIAVLIIAVLLYRQNRLKQKSNNLITNKNEQLQHLLTEKEWLLKEIHHRVKNNFQTVMGLLGTQSGYLKNEVAKNAITDSRRRIQSMSLIHQRLYQSNNLSAIKMTDYVYELVDSLSDSFNIGNHARFNLQIEPIELDLAHCIPLGLIMNEAITNAFKYAFPGNKEGVISISFKNTSTNNFELHIADNGIGLPQDFELTEPGSMGLNLMRGLCEEIGAQFKIAGENGTQITVSFEYDPDTAIEMLQVKSDQLI